MDERELRGKRMNMNTIPNWVTIKRDALVSPYLSWKAKGIYAYLCSLGLVRDPKRFVKKHWWKLYKPYIDQLLIENPKEMNELISNGYLEVRNDNY